MAPIKVYSILSPVAGHIAKLGFEYGDSVKQGQLIATITADGYSVPMKNNYLITSVKKMPWKQLRMITPQPCHYLKLALKHKTMFRLLAQHTTIVF